MATAKWVRDLGYERFRLHGNKEGLLQLLLDKVAKECRPEGQDWQILRQVSFSFFLHFSSSLFFLRYFSFFVIFFIFSFVVFFLFFFSQFFPSFFFFIFLFFFFLSFFMFFFLFFLISFSAHVSRTSWGQCALWLHNYEAQVSPIAGCLHNAKQNGKSS